MIDSGQPQPDHSPERIGGGFRLYDASPDQIPAIAELIAEHGPNQWNFLPTNGIREHLAGIADGRTGAVVAEEDDTLIGVVTYEIGSFYPEYQPPERSERDHGYLAEAVVAREQTGRDIGPRLVRLAISRMAASGVREVYAKRHADNRPSARMMEKCGMTVVAEFDDHAIRPSGSRRTAVTRLLLPR